ncbi:hypothetical protein ExPCM14_03498 [Escherichia coli]|nr:hypothetical protein ExPCM14_03498 [Escherichia coli]
MDIRSAFFDCLCQHGVDQFDDRRIVVTFQQIFRFRQFFSEGKKVLGGTEIFHQLASFGRVPLPDRIQPLFKFGLVDLPQRKGRVQPPL